MGGFLNKHSDGMTCEDQMGASNMVEPLSDG